MSRDQECQEKKKKELKDVEKAKLEEPEEDEPILEEDELILEEDEYNPEGFDPYPKDPKEEKDGGIRKDFDMKFDFEML